MDNKYIQFIDSHYNNLFSVEDGKNVIVNYSDGERRSLPCKYIDNYHTQIGSNVFHICEFAEVMERSGNTYEPEEYIKNLDFYPKRYLDRELKAVDGSLIPFAVFDENEKGAFAYCPKGKEHQLCFVDKVNHFDITFSDNWEDLKEFAAFAGLNIKIIEGTLKAMDVPVIGQENVSDEKAVEVWYWDEKTGINAGRNAAGELFVGNDKSGANLPDTQENRKRLKAEFERLTDKTMDRSFLDAKDNIICFDELLVEPHEKLINAAYELWVDVDSSFGTDVEDIPETYINFYTNLHMDTGEIKAIYSIDSPDKLDQFDRELSAGEQAMFKEKMADYCKSTYGCSLEELWNETVKEHINEPVLACQLVTKQKPELDNQIQSAESKKVMSQKNAPEKNIEPEL